MSKKFNLQKKCQNILQQQKVGSKATRREQQRVMSAIMDDLDRLRRLPRDFTRITQNDIKCLVDFWKKKQLSHATIGNKLGILRRFNQLAKLDLIIPSNKELNCIKASPTALKMTIPDNFEKQIFHPLSQSIIALQLHFGLTKLEAIRLNPTGVCVDNVLLIDRTMAYNKKDRVIPIITKTQIDTIKQRNSLIETSQFLKKSNANSLTLINRLYTAECYYAGINPNTPFRQRYAENRLKILEQAHGNQTALLTLCKEMGCSSPRKLLGYL